MNKQVSQLRFKGFNDNWQKEQYKNIVNYCSNGFVGTVVNYYVSSNDKNAVRYIVGANVKLNKFDLNVQVNYVNKDFQLKYPKAQIHTNDMLMVQSGDIGTCCVVSEDLNNDYCHALIINRFKEHINPYFMAEYLNFNRGKQKLSLLFTGSTIKHINVKDLLHFIIKVPNFNKQSKIGQFFNKLDDLITLHTKKLKLLKKKREAYLPENGKVIPKMRFNGFNDVWKNTKLKDLGDILTGNTPSTKNPCFYDDNGTLWVTPSDIDNNIITNTQKKLSEEGLKHARVIPANSLLITCIASIGKNAITYQCVAFNQQINALIPNQDNNSYFLLTASHFWSKKMQSLTNAGMMAIFNKTDFSELIVQVPTLVEQQKIGQFFEKLDNLITLEDKKITLLKRKKQAYLQKMFI